MNTTSTFGNDGALPCVDCGQHPLRAHHDRNGAAFTHYYVPPIEHEQPAPEGEEWRSVDMSDPSVDHKPIITIEQGDKLLATAHSFAAAEQIIRDHRLAALVPGLVEALRGVQLRGCWCELPPNITSPDHTIECDAARAALNAVAKERELTDKGETK